MSILKQDEAIPLVIVEGFLAGAGGAALWGAFESHLNSGRTKRGTIFASVGPVSSLHDRACELYYALKGGTVDYGEEHSANHNHSRYGRAYERGYYPAWSRTQPLHFLGHSMGGPTIIKLQWLLKSGFFGDHGHSDMLLSVTTVSAPFRGTQLVYTLGERADAAPAVRPFSLGAWLAKGVHVLSFLSPLLPSSLDLHTESRRLSYRESSFLSFFKQLWKSDWAESRDATPFDVTFAAADERESCLEGEVHANTFYRSHVASMTRRSSQHGNGNYHKPTTSRLSLLYLPSRMMGSFDYVTIHPRPSFMPESINSLAPTTNDAEQGLLAVDTTTELGEEYWENDGIVPVFSQWHPLACNATRCIHLRNIPELSIPKTKPRPEPGVWHVHHIDEASHSSLVPLWSGCDRQRQFWEGLGDWLYQVENLRQ